METINGFQQGLKGYLKHHAEEDSKVKSGLNKKEHHDCPATSTMERKVQHGCQLIADPDSGSMLKVYR